MAQIENGGGKAKSHQKKMTIRVDFTPMVDMNMLLITFFMLCTTMIKTQTINIALPSNKKLDRSQMNQASTADALTIIIDAKRFANKPEIADTTSGALVPMLYYYEGKPDEIKSQPIIANDVVTLNGEEKLIFSNSDPKEGIRKILQKKNDETLKKVNALRESLKDKEGKVDQAKFDAGVAAIWKDVNNEIQSKPVVIIKSTPEAPYGALVSVLDEMQINSIARYQIENLSHNDSLLLKDYLRRHPDGK